MNKKELIEKQIKVKLEQDYIDNKGNYWREGTYDPRELSESLIAHGSKYIKILEDKIEESSIVREPNISKEKEDIIKVVPQIKSRKKQDILPKPEFQDLTPKKDNTIRIEKQ
jgi:hypothetical protein